MKKTMKKKLFLTISLLCFLVPTQAQIECEQWLEEAAMYYKAGNYQKAANMYQFIQKECGDKNYGGAAAKLKDCNQKLKEDADFRKCVSIETCDAYLENYPHGRYVAKVEQKRAKIIKDMENAQIWAEEDEAFQKCSTKKDFDFFLKNYPDGRHADQAMEELAQFERERLMREEDSAFSKCISEADCEAFLKAYPWGTYYATVWAKKNELVRKRLLEEEATRIGYMRIERLDIANVSTDGTVIASGSLLDADIKYLTPIITYNGILDEARRVELFYKIIKPDGTLLSFPNSPLGYTSSDVFIVQPGSNNVRELTSCGNGGKEEFVSGVYKIELWYEDIKIFGTSFGMKEKENRLSRGDWRKVLQKCHEDGMRKLGNGGYKGECNEEWQLSGLGMCVLNNGTYYIGAWGANKWNGAGIYITPRGCFVTNCSDCAYYVGEFSSGNITGTGSCYNRFGKLIYHGGFVDGEPEEPCPMKGLDNYKFECVEYSSGEYYIGETMNGERHGKGFYIYSNGDLWYGDWEDDKRNGSGILLQYHGDVSSGIWKKDVKKK